MCLRVRVFKFAWAIRILTGLRCIVTQYLRFHPTLEGPAGDIVVIMEYGQRPLLETSHRLELLFQWRNCGPSYLRNDDRCSRS